MNILRYRDKCSKCGGHDLSMIYYPMPDAEYLSTTCKRCGYSWNMETWNTEEMRIAELHTQAFMRNCPESTL